MRIFRCAHFSQHLLLGPRLIDRKLSIRLSARGCGTIKNEMSAIDDKEERHEPARQGHSGNAALSSLRDLQTRLGPEKRPLRSSPRSSPVALKLARSTSGMA